MSNSSPPAFKLIPGTNFIVDGFRYSSGNTTRTFFLSHAHSDHYTGLKADWSLGPIYCSATTALLTEHLLGVDKQWLRSLPLDTPVTIEGVQVILVDANHCPGAVQFLFQLPDQRKYVHTGDMRYSPAMEHNTHLQRFRGADGLYLDTTYCNPRYTFPCQEESIEYVASTIHTLMQPGGSTSAQPEGQQAQQAEHTSQCSPLQAPHSRLFLISTYGVGKERVLAAVRRRCGVRLHVAERKLGVMQCLDLAGFSSQELFTTDAAETPIRVVQWGFLGETWPFFRPNFQNMEAYRLEHGVDEVVGFVPTGWMYEMKRATFSVRRKGGCCVHLVPYSEHSSYQELLEYVKFIRPHRVIPTVGVGGEDAERSAARMLRHFRHLVDETASKARFLSGFGGHPKRTRSGRELPQLTGGEEERKAEQGGGKRGMGCAEKRGAGDKDCVGEKGQGELQVKEEDLEGEEEGFWGPAEGEGSQVGVAAGHAEVQVKAEDVRAEHAEPGTKRARCAPVAVQQPQQAQQEGQLPAVISLLEESEEEGVRQEAEGQGGGRGRPPAQLAVPQPVQSTQYAQQGGGAQPGVAAADSKGAKLLLEVDSAGDEGEGGGGAGAAGSAAAVGGPTASPADLASADVAGPSSREGPSSASRAAELAGLRHLEAVLGAGAMLEAQALQLLAAAGGNPQRAINMHFDGWVPGSNGGSPGGGTSPAGGGCGRNPAPASKTGQPEAAAAGGGLQLGAAGGKREAVGREHQVPRDAVTLPPDKYNPVLHAPWEPGHPTPYLHLARALEAMDSTTKRLRISDVLVNTFRSVLAVSPADLVATAYLATGKVAPDYEGMELSVGGSTVSAAVQEATGVSRSKLREMYNALGDIGDVAQACKRTQATLQRPAPLTVPGVLATLRGLAEEKGQGAAGRRQRSVLGLLRACRESEPKYLTRTLVQALRVGANWRSVVPALAKAVLMHREGPGVSKAQFDAVGAAATAAFHVCPNLDLLVGALVEGPLEELGARCTLTPGIPIKPMLAKISEGIPDALRQLKGAPFLAEYKYDGMRAQIHLLQDGRVRIFSRNCEDRTSAYPDVAQQLREATGGGVTSLIVDAELVAVERDPGGGASRTRAFQELASRARGDVADVASISVAVCVFVFDLLFLEGRSLLGEPLSQRREALQKALPCMRPGHVALAESHLIPSESTHQPPLHNGSSNPAPPPDPAPHSAQHAQQQGRMDGEELGGEKRGLRESSGPKSNAGARLIDITSSECVNPPQQETQHAEHRLHDVLMEAFAAGTEGVVLKRLDAAYQPSKRSEHWVKLKRDYCEGLHDTLDLVPIGAWYGNGRKVGWFSPFLMAVYDPEAEQFQSLCRCMSGFSDAFYKEATARLSQRILPSPKPYYRTSETPDVWFEVGEVWEIRGADLSISPVHKAAEGRVHPDRGVGLRFPRFLRIRDDKAPEDASSAETVVQLYQAQTRKVEAAGQKLATAATDGFLAAQSPLPAAAAAEMAEEEGQLEAEAEGGGSEGGH